MKQKISFSIFYYAEATNKFLIRSKQYRLNSENELKKSLTSLKEKKTWPKTKYKNNNNKFSTATLSWVLQSIKLSSN